MEFEYSRLLVAFLSGVLLSISGTLVQSITQNDLASPSTLGLNALSVLVILFCHFLAVLFGGQSLFEYLPFIISLGFSLLMYFFSRRKLKVDEIFGNRQDTFVKKWVLWGLCFNLFVGAMFSLAQFVFISLNLSFPDQLWFGNFRYVDEISTIILLIMSILIYYYSWLRSSHFRSLSFGSEIALGLGVDVKRLGAYGLIIAFICVSTVNSFFGVFAFIGLVFPHLLRSMNVFSKNLSMELRFGSLLSGLCFMILDLCCYNFVIYGAEIPVGMITSLLGTIALLVVLWKKNQNVANVDLKVAK